MAFLVLVKAEPTPIRLRSCTELGTFGLLGTSMHLPCLGLNTFPNNKQSDPKIDSDRHPNILLCLFPVKPSECEYHKRKTLSIGPAIHLFYPAKIDLYGGRSRALAVGSNTVSSHRIENKVA